MHDVSALTNRISKNYKRLTKWARRYGISCFRVYDSDIPELKFVVEIFGDFAVCYDRTVSHGDESLVSPEELTAAVAKGLGFTPDRVIIKQRRRMAGKDQYQKLGEGGNFFVVHEGTSKYLVNLTDYLDCGLFLDHRPLRDWLRRPRTEPWTLLNLFCYTGAISVAAAQGGAVTTSVDMSNTYLDWARENLRLNGFHGDSHELIRDDVLKFLSSTSKRFDMIVLDPPTFSNSKKMDGSFDVQRDHLPLINKTMKLLAPGGRLIFSTNRRRFVLDQNLRDRFVVSDVSEAALPLDMRDRRARFCFVLAKEAAAAGIEEWTK